MIATTTPAGETVRPPHKPTHPPLDLDRLRSRARYYCRFATLDHPGLVLDVDDVAQEAAAIILSTWESFDPDRGTYLNWEWARVRLAVRRLAVVYRTDRRVDLDPDLLPGRQPYDGPPASPERASAVAAVGRELATMEDTTQAVVLEYAVGEISTTTAPRLGLTKWDVVNRRREGLKRIRAAVLRGRVRTPVDESAGAREADDRYALLVSVARLLCGLLAAHVARHPPRPPLLPFTPEQWRAYAASQAVWGLLQLLTRHVAYMEQFVRPARGASHTTPAAALRLLADEADASAIHN